MPYFSKYSTFPLKKLHYNKLMLMIQHNNNTVCTPFQPHVIDIINNIKLYHGSHSMTYVVFDHRSKARHSIDYCIDLRFKWVIFDLLQYNGLDKLWEGQIRIGCQYCATFKFSNMLMITSPTKCIICTM